MISEIELMHEVMVDAFLHLEEENLKDKSVRDILMAWVKWVDARYKVAHIPDVCYAIIDCEDGDLVSMINVEIPDAKQKAYDMCAYLNKDAELSVKDDTPTPSDMVNIKEVSEAYLNMDESSFMDFLLGHSFDTEKEE